MTLMKTLALIIAVAALAILLLAKPNGFHSENRTTERPEETAPTHPNPTPYLPPIPIIKTSDLFSFQGVIKNITRDGIVFACEEWTPPSNPWMNFNAGATAGATEIKNMAQLAGDYDQKAFIKAYGGLLALKNGVLCTAGFQPQNNGSGTVLLVGVPPNDLLQPGKRIRLVGAPTGQTFNNLPVFSVRYEYKVFSEIRTLRGAILRNVMVTRRDSDGFVVGAGNQVWKVYDFELDPKTRAVLSAECR